MVVSWIYFGLIWKKGRQKFLQLLILVTQFLNPGYDLDAMFCLLFVSQIYMYSVMNVEESVF